MQHYVISFEITKSGVCCLLLNRESRVVLNKMKAITWTDHKKIMAHELDSIFRL